jgi:hypothetical protein
MQSALKNAIISPKKVPVAVEPSETIKIPKQTTTKVINIELEAFSFRKTQDRATPMTGAVEYKISAFAALV